MVKIDFLVPGFSKCGSTTLCALIAQHPELFIPEIDEPWYFSALRYAERAEEYNALFDRARPGQKLGEGSVTYSGFRTEDVSIRRIHEHNPDCRFIFIARNPLKRIESSFREMHHSGVQFGIDAPYSLSACMELLPEIVNDSCFFERINKYVEAFGESALLVLFLEDLVRAPEPALRNSFAHLGVDPDFPVETGLHLNQGSAKLYDTRLLRRIRNWPPTGMRLAKIHPFAQDRFLRPLGLRRAFGKKPVDWDPEARRQVNERVIPDAKRFLEAFGKPADFWKLTLPDA